MVIKKNGSYVDTYPACQMQMPKYGEW